MMAGGSVLDPTAPSWCADAPTAEPRQPTTSPTTSPSTSPSGTSGPGQRRLRPRAVSSSSAASSAAQDDEDEEEDRGRQPPPAVSSQQARKVLARLQAQAQVQAQTHHYHHNGILLQQQQQQQQQQRRRRRQSLLLGMDRLSSGIDAAYERLSVSLDREHARGSSAGGVNNGSSSSSWGGGAGHYELDHHVRRERLLLVVPARRREGRADQTWRDGSAEGRQDAEDDQDGRADAGADDDAAAAEALLHRILFHGKNGRREDAEVRRAALSDVEMVYHHANANAASSAGAGGGGEWGTGKRLRNSIRIGRPGLVRTLRALADEFGESGEIVEIALSFLDRYLMAKSSPANDDFVYTNYIGATGTTADNDGGDGLLPALDPAWSIYVASLACLRIAIKAHSPYGDRGSPFSPFPPEHAHAHAHAPAPSNEQRMAILSDHWSYLRAHPDQMDPYMYRPVEDTLVAHLVAAGGPSDGGGGGTASTARSWCAGTARAVLVRTETDVLHALEFRLIPITSWAVAHDLVALVDGIVRRERLAHEVAAEDDRFRRLQHAAMMAGTGNLPGGTEGTERGFDSEEDKVHRLGGSSSTDSAFSHTPFHGPRRFPINIDRSRLTELTTQQLTSALEDAALLPVQRSVLARAAVQNALVRLNVESEAAAGVSIAGMVVPGTEPRSQYEAGRALVGSLCAEMRFVCTTPYGDWEEDCQENTETEMAFHFAAAGLQKHLDCFLDREMMETTGRYHGRAARTGGMDTTMCSAPRVVTPCGDSPGSGRSANDGKDCVAKEAEFVSVDNNGGGSTADSALVTASERQHQAKKARKGKKRGVGRLHTGYSPGYGGSGRAILNK